MAPRKPKSAAVVAVRSPVSAAPVAPVVTAPVAPVASAPVETVVAVAAPVVPPQFEAGTEVLPPVVPEMAEAVDAVVASGAELQDSVRRLTEQGLEQTRGADQRLRSAAEDATDQFEATYQTASTGLRELNSAAFDAFRANADATFEFLKAMLGVRDLSEAIQLQTEHVRKQVEALNCQAKDIGAVAQRVAATSAEALKATLEKGLGRAA